MDRETAELHLPDGTRVRAISCAAMFRAHRHDVATHAVVGGLIAASVASDANDEMAADWRQKEMPAPLYIMPGQRAGGFIIFRKPKGKGPYSLVLAGHRTRSSRRVVLQLDL
jgi:hypothetical protein